MNEQTNGHPPASIIDTLRARRDAAAGSRHMDYDVPGYGGLMVLRLGPLPAQALARITRLASRSAVDNFAVNADTIVAATQDVLGRARRGDELQSLGGDEPIGVDDRLADLLGIETANARALLRELFAKANSPEVALSGLAADYSEWARDASSEVDTEFVGESKPVQS